MKQLIKWSRIVLTTVGIGFALVGCKHTSAGLRPKDLIEACQRGDLVVVDRCLDSGLSPNAPFTSADGTTITPLYVAAAKNQFAVVRRLCELGADVNFATKSGSTALSVAINRSASPELIEYLLQHHANGSQNGALPLDAAVYIDNASVIALLLKYGANPNRGDRRHNEPPLILARSAKAVHLLIAAGANPNASDRDGYSPMFAMAASGYAAAIRELIHMGGNPCQADKRGLTAMTWAIEYFDPNWEHDYLDSIALLRCPNANLRLKDARGKSAFDYAMKLKNPKINALLGIISK